MADFNLCADFSHFPDNHPLGSRFVLAAFRFVQLGGANELFVNVTGAERGLSFPKEGVEITLPTPLPAVTLRLGTFGGPVVIKVVDGAGDVVQTLSVPHGDYQDIPLAAPEIASLRLYDGSGEGIIPRVCVVIRA